ncbi:type III secretion system chaperone [Parendozoicomonas haliclonae]|uniref:Tir chaperone protein (CesT) n=1 Tax=Parendozoicomonas haliclonae TaxID=1960125 RepID=A0A1X7AHE7_9GAMM|nr:type III secretion system chaperone [Parendozoicomonas haliclonae]SMA42348.1 Tir chaperone protein (CesT) [Parendozoicomonas haliclonae]
MSHRQNVEENLQRFAEGIGLGELKLNEHGACGLCFDDTLIVNMEYLEEDEALVFVSAVKPVDMHASAEDKLAQFEKLLFINLQHHSMQGAYLALNHDKTEILLIRSMTAGIDYGAFESTLEKFVNTLEWVVQEASNLSGDDAAPQSPSAGAGSGSAPPAQPDGGMGIMV